LIRDPSKADALIGTIAHQVKSSTNIESRKIAMQTAYAFFHAKIAKIVENNFVGRLESILEG